MPKKYAILIDAGFLKRKLGSQTDPMTADKVVNFTEKLSNRSELLHHDLHRIYYYDAQPLGVKKLKPLTGGSEVGERYDFTQVPLYSSNTQLLEDLKRKPFFAIRLGETSFRGWIVKPQLLNAKKTRTEITITKDNLIPSVQQKGVDMRIGLDIASLSLKEQVDIIVLVSGDSDFIPTLKFARREGRQVFLYTLGHGIKDEIYEHTDLCIEDKEVNL